MKERQTSAYWVCRRGAGELRRQTVPATPRPGHSILRAEFSGISPGTERLVGLGQVPESCATVMACRYMQGDFQLPVEYGYSLVGTAVGGGLQGRRVFVMHPHQGQMEIQDTHATLLPDDVPAARATLIPNLETALNAAWDAELSGNERVVILGAGPVGLLLAFVLERVHAVPVTLADKDAARLDTARQVGWVPEVVAAEQLPKGAFDVAFHCTGSPAGLQNALCTVGFEGCVLDLSWYGEQQVALNLGSDFHYLRKRIVASQVGTIAPSRRDTYGYAERTAEVVALLDDARLDNLLKTHVAFEELPQFMGSLYQGLRTGIAPVVHYESHA